MKTSKHFAWKQRSVWRKKQTLVFQIPCEDRCLDPQIPLEKAFGGFKHLLTRYLGDLQRLGQNHSPSVWRSCNDCRTFHQTHSIKFLLLIILLKWALILGKGVVMGCITHFIVTYTTHGQWWNSLLSWYIYIYVHIIPTITTQPLHNKPFAASGNFLDQESG